MLSKIETQKTVKILTAEQQELIKGGGIIIEDLTMS